MQNLLIPCHKLACHTCYRPTYHLLAAKQTTKNKGHTKKSVSRRNKRLNTFLESRQGTGPKTEKDENKRSKRIRQNNKRADRKLDSNDSPEPARRHQKRPASFGAQELVAQGGGGEGSGGCFVVVLTDWSAWHKARSVDPPQPNSLRNPALYLAPVRQYR